MRRRPIPDRDCPLRGHPAARDVPQARRADGGTANARAHVHARTAVLLPTRARGGRGGGGDAIERVGVGPEAMTVRELSALLYLPGHTARQLQRAIAIPALAEGWRRSFEALLEQAA